MPETNAGTKVVSSRLQDLAIVVAELHASESDPRWYFKILSRLESLDQIPAGITIDLDNSTWTSESGRGTFPFGIDDPNELCINVMRCPTGAVLAIFNLADPDGLTELVRFTCLINMEVRFRKKQGLEFREYLV